jgi:hypothetical protein
MAFNAGAGSINTLAGEIKYSEYSSRQLFFGTSGFSEPLKLPADITNSALNYLANLSSTYVIALI